MTNYKLPITHYQLPNTNLPALHALPSPSSFLPPFCPPSFLASSLPSYLPSCLHTPIPFFCFSQPSLPPSYILKEQQLNNVRWFNHIRYSKGRASRRALSLSPRAFAQPGYSYKKMRCAALFEKLATSIILFTYICEMSNVLQYIWSQAFTNKCWPTVNVVNASLDKIGDVCIKKCAARPLFKTNNNTFRFCENH